MKHLGFDAKNEVVDSVFDGLDTDKSGILGVQELVRFQQDRGANEVHGRNGLRKSQGHKGAALPPTAKLDEFSEQSVSEQLRDFLVANAVRVIDVFRDWDDDDSGTISKA